ncbi:mRNA-decapping enzyme-like protein [Raphanus sativus]|uniref:mRNA-decapping enzyme-like protein n=1 Tax=Raphanus sativus TaxID=3726 RepID=A0A6J0JAN8_RAPSA|nr:mRNA-decapping enzyme-like protein [Raphanus sativus]KAJ4895470.1 mRNA-decapping enzyme-like protein [Raphanus sativus]
MSQNGKLVPPNMDQNSTRLLNLTVLQRIDPFIEEILITAAHVTFYEFNIEISQWSRKDVEGSLFVVKRNKQQPRFQFIVMNRRNTDNLVEDLLGDFEYEVQGPYLLYRNASQEVNGIWFYNERECVEVARLFDRLLSAYSKANQKPNTSSSKSEFEELEAVPTMAAMDGPLEPSLTARDAPNDPAFVNFFSSAMALGNTSSGTSSGPPYQSSPTPLQPHQPTVAPPAPPQPLQSSSPIMPHFEYNPDLINSNPSVQIDLVTPSSFFAPPRTMTQPHLIPSSSTPTAPPLNFNNATHHQQRQHGTPMLQPFPPPNPPPSLAPPAQSVPVINRDKVKQALLTLVQENEFIDMVTRALQNAHQP